MVRAVGTIVMQMLIISLIKALEGGKRGEGVELTLIELHVLTPTRQEFSRPAQTGYLGLGGRGAGGFSWFVKCWGLRLSLSVCDPGFSYIFIMPEGIHFSEPQTRSLTQLQEKLTNYTSNNT